MGRYGAGAQAISADIQGPAVADGNGGRGACSANRIGSAHHYRTAVDRNSSGIGGTRGVQRKHACAALLQSAAAGDDVSGCSRNIARAIEYQRSIISDSAGADAAVCSAVADLQRAGVDLSGSGVFVGPGVGQCHGAPAAYRQTGGAADRAVAGECIRLGGGVGKDYIARLDRCADNDIRIVQSTIVKGGVVKIVIMVCCWRERGVVLVPVYIGEIPVIAGRARPCEICRGDWANLKLNIMKRCIY